LHGKLCFPIWQVKSSQKMLCIKDLPSSGCQWHLSWGRWSTRYQV
jgi:hypothetical protein